MLRFSALFALSLPVAAMAAAPSGEHLAYTVGCVNCHHQTPKEIVNAPPLTIVSSYSLSEFRRLMKSGVTRGGRNMLAQSSVMGIVATEQFSHFTDDEVFAIYSFLTKQWTAQRAMKEEEKNPVLYKAQAHKGETKP